MSGDLYLVQFQDGANAAFDPKPTRAVVERYCIDPVKPPCNPMLCTLADGLVLEIYVGGLDGSKPFHGAMFSLRGYTEATAHFICDFTRSGDMTILNTGKPTVLLTASRQMERLPVELRDGQQDQTVLVDSAASLNAALTGGFEAWRKYRNHVVEGQ